MLDEALLTMYRRDREKTASREVVEKLKEFSVEELFKLASGDPTSKLAFLGDCLAGNSLSGGCTTWLDQYKGTPLFEQAVELERALLQVDAEDQARRGAEREESQSRWDARDALNLKKRMLDLDLALSQAGGGGGGAAPEAQEEKGVQLLEQAQAEERAQGEGGEPHEQAEDQAIQQFRQAQSQEVAAQQPPKPPAQPKPPQGAEAAPGGEEAEEQPKKPKSGMSVEVKQAGAWGSDSRRVAPGSNNDTVHPERAQGAGALADYTPSSDDHFSTVTEGVQAAKIAAAINVGRVLARAGLTKAAADLTPHGSSSEKEHVRAAVARKYPGLGGSEKKAYLTPGLMGAVAGGKKSSDEGKSPAWGAVRGFAGADIGSDLGADLGHRAGAETARMLGLNPIKSRAAGTLAGIAGGGYLGYKALTGGKKKPESSEKKAGVLGALSAAVPKAVSGLQSAVTTAAPKVMSGLQGAASGAKSLVQTAHAAGGLPQVARSLGNVGVQFAKQNPVATAGVAGVGAGMLARRALSPSQPQVVVQR